MPLVLNQWAVGFDEETQKVSATFAISVEVLIIFLAIYLTWLVTRRHKNWVRWLFLISFVAEVVLLIAAFPKISRVYELRPLGATIDLVKMVLEAAALFFIFTGNARQWFSRGAA